MENKINELINSIKQAFAGVKLGTGVSWREASVIDDYGSINQRKLARDQDEIEDWNLINFELIGALKYQDVMPFLDNYGLRFYLPICMIYTLMEYEVSESVITQGLVSSLTRKATVADLKAILSEEQIACVVLFLKSFIEISFDNFYTRDIENAIKNYW